MLVDVTSGSENYPESSAKAYVFFVPNPSLREFETEKHLWIAARDTTDQGLIRQIRSDRFLAMPGKPLAWGGWSQATFDIRPGSILKLFGTLKGAHRLPGQYVSAAMYVRLREGAATRRVRTALTGRPGAALRSADLIGRFDVLDLEGVEALGVVVPTFGLSSLNPDNQAALFTVQQLEPETAPQVEVSRVPVKSSEGETVMVAVRRSRRALDL